MYQEIYEWQQKVCTVIYSIDEKQKIESQCRQLANENEVTEKEFVNGVLSYIKKHLNLEQAILLANESCKYLKCAKI